MALEKRFYHEVVSPLTSLRARASENVCIEPDYSDVLTLAKQVAITVFHFREPYVKIAKIRSVPPMTDKDAETNRQRLSDIADTVKHGKLDKPERIVVFSTALAFEVNDNDQFRYIRTEVLAQNDRFGCFEISDTIEDFVCSLSKELNIATPKFYTPVIYQFRPSAEIFLTEKSGFELSSVRIRIYRRDTNGALELSDHPNIKVEILGR
jgi:hypothetical protein